MPAFNKRFVMMIMAFGANHYKIFNPSIRSIMINMMNMCLMKFSSFRPRQIDTAHGTGRIWNQSFQMASIRSFTSSIIVMLNMPWLRESLIPRYRAFLKFSGWIIAFSFICLRNPRHGTAFPGSISASFRAIQTLAIFQFERPYIKLFMALLAYSENHNNQYTLSCLPCQ